MVTTIADTGEGSLRQAILDANAGDGPVTISFDATNGPFATPQTITLESPLPVLFGQFLIDGYIEDRLWKPNGVTVSGANSYRVFEVSDDANVTIRSLTIADGRAQHGAGITNRGELIVKGVTLVANVADEDGGAIANFGKELTVINSTFAGNRSGHAGGGLANLTGNLTVTNSTFAGNTASTGAGLYSKGSLLLRNSILANSEGSGADCVVAGTLDVASTNNLIEVSDGCGTPISTADPRLGQLGRYNGPTPTLPLGGASPAINLGDNASALDENGKPLRWDQRGNGDPRFVAGFTDIGAFEYQAFPVLHVNLYDDSELRACTQSGTANCSLRGAIMLANAMSQPAVITFDPRVFSERRTITLTRPLPEVTADLTLDASATGGVTLTGEFARLRTTPATKLTLNEVALQD